MAAVRFDGDDIIEANLDINATHSGEEFMGIPVRGRKIRFEVHARGRFVDGKLAEQLLPCCGAIRGFESRPNLLRRATLQ